MGKLTVVPSVITPLDEHMGLDIARSLHDHGVPVYGLDSDVAAVGRFSAACRFRLAPNPEHSCDDYLQSLVDFSKQLGCRPALFPLSDFHVLLVSEHRNLLQDYFQFVMPDHKTILRLSTKAGLLDLAKELQIPAPAALQVRTEQEIDEAAETLRFPVILKPSESTAWHNPRITRLLRRGLLEGRAKVVLCPNAASLKELYHQIESFGGSMIVQEVIPGEDARLFYFASYFNRESRPLGIFAGRKDRVIPIGFGSASFVRSYHEPELIRSALQVLESSRYQGLGGVELKKDPRDEVYKLIEVNARFGMWDGLGVRCGVDLPYIAYRDTIGEAVPSQFTYREGVIWIDWQRDFRAAASYRRQGLLTWKQWWKSLGGEKMWAIYSWRDPLPGMFFTLRLIGKLLERMGLRLGSVLEKARYGGAHGTAVASAEGK